MDLTLPEWLHSTGRVLLRLLPLAVLTIWCLWAVNWRKAWPVLAAGGWAPLVLIGLMAAAVWPMIWPVPLRIAGLGTMPNGVWQPIAVALVLCVVLFCGWVQSRSGYTPPEVDLNPPTHDHGHDAHAHH